MKQIFNVSLDPEKSLIENFEEWIGDCEVMLGIFKDKAEQAHYDKMKAYLEKAIKEIKNDR